MPLPLKEYVQQVMLERDRAAKIYSAVFAAWAAVNAKNPDRYIWLRKAAFRNLFWEECVRELRTIGLSDPDFSFIQHRDTASFIVENAVLFRVKHAKTSLETANVPTIEAIRFDDHDVDLYGFSDFQRIELCYVLNEFETSIDWVGFSARSNGVHLWKIELNQYGIVKPHPELALFEPEEDTAKLVTLKKQSIKKQDDDKRNTGEL